MNMKHDIPLLMVSHLDQGSNRGLEMRRNQFKVCYIIIITAQFDLKI